MSNRIVLFVKLLNSIRKRNNIKDIYAKSHAIYNEMGCKGLLKCINNKLNGRPLKSGFGQTNDIYLKQQKEFKQLAMEHNLGNITDKMCISLIMPIDNFDINGLKLTIQSIEEQVYDDWNVYILVDDETECDKIALIESYAKKDMRIIIIRCKEVYNSINYAIKNAKGKYITIVDSMGEFTKDAFYWIMKAINEQLDVDFLYSDECEINENGEVCLYINKPQWSKYFLINAVYTGNLEVYSKDVLKKLGGINEKFKSVYRYELVTRIGDIARNIIHIPRILFCRKYSAIIKSANHREMEDTLKRAVLRKWLEKQGANVNIIKRDRFYYPHIMSNYDKVSIVVVCKINNNISEMINKIIDNTSYRNYEIIVILEDQKMIKKIEGELFNVKYCINQESNIYFGGLKLAGSICTGKFIVYLDEYCYPNNVDWLEGLLDGLGLPDVRAVSPVILDDAFRVMFAGSTIQYSNGYCLCGTPYQFYNFKEKNSNEILNPFLIKETKGLARYCFALKKDTLLNILNDCENDISLNSLIDYISYVGYIDDKVSLYVPMASIICTKEKLTSDEASIWYSLFKCKNFFLEDKFFNEQMRHQLSQVEEERQVMIYNSKLNEYCRGNRILLISHELSLTGAPIVALDTARELVAAGYNVVVASPFDGPLRKSLEELGVPIIIDVKLAWGRFVDKTVSLFKDSWYMDYLIKDVDLIIVNSLCGHNLINRYEGEDVPIMWWLHEGSFGYEIAKDFLSKKLLPNIHVYCGGMYPKKMLNKYGFEYGEKVLLYGVDDKKVSISEKKHNKITFLIVGSIERRKAQDIVFSAIAKMKKHLLSQCEFVFLGGKTSDAVFDDISAIEKQYENVKILPPIPREQLYTMYTNMDCLICPSRDDPMPVVITESMMFSKAVICSTNVGQAQYINDGKNGLVFQSDDVDMLLDKISYVIENKSVLSSIGKEARKLYEEYFSMSVFRKNILSEVYNLIQ